MKTGRADPDFYDLLEIDPGATDEEVRRAYKRLNKRYDPTSAVVYGLYKSNELQALARLLKEAYETLVDPEKRRRYDRRLYPEGHPSLRRADQRPAAAPPPPPRPLPPADPIAASGLPVDTPWRGPFIQKLREVCHLSLEEIAERTKISMFTLRCIEGEQYEDLPARVYMRGFLKQIAQILRIDVDKLRDDYMRGYEEWHEAQGHRKW